VMGAFMLFSFLASEGIVEFFFKLDELHLKLPGNV
jgi:hypothetical protein